MLPSSEVTVGGTPPHRSGATGEARNKSTQKKGPKMTKLVSVSGVQLHACESQPEGLINVQANACKCCGTISLPIRALTMRNMVRDNLQSFINEGFYFCSSPNCEVAYFDNGSGRYFSKADLKVRVGIKETEHPVPVCYCVEVTEADILRSSRREGCCNTLDDIKCHTGARTGHECQTKNPSGRCCDEHVRKVIAKGLAMRGDGQVSVPEQAATDRSGCCGESLNEKSDLT